MGTDGTEVLPLLADTAVDVAPVNTQGRRYLGSAGDTRVKLNDGSVLVPYTGKAAAASHANPWFDLGAYGSVDRTGVVSCDTAVTAAMTAIAASPRGGTLWLGPGVLNISTGKIDFSTGVGATTAPVCVRGADRALTVIVPNGTGDVVKLNAAADGCSVRDLAIFSSGATQTAGNAVNTNGADDVLIDNCLFNNQFVDVFVNNTSIKVSIQRCVHTHGVNNGVNSVGILVANGAAGDTYIGPDVVMSDTGAVRRRASVEVVQSGHFEINQANLTGSAQGLLVDPGAGQIVADGFINHSLFDSCTVNGVTLNAATATSTIKSIHFVNSWFSGTTVGAGQAGLLSTGAAGGILDGIEFVSCRALNNQTHGYQHGFGTGFRWLGGRASGNSAAANNTSDGINIAANISNFTIVGVKSGGTDGAQTGGQQRWGINIAAGTGTNYLVTDCDLLGNVTGGVSDLGTGTARAVGNNIGALIQGKIASLTVPTAALTAADTLVLSAPVPANALQVGTVLRVKASGQYAGTVSNAVNFRVRFGTAGTIADAALVTITTAAGGTATVGFDLEVTIIVRTTGATAGLLANGRCFGVPAAALALSNTVATVAVNSTVANFIELTAGVAAVTSNITFHQCSIEVVG